MNSTRRVLLAEDDPLVGAVLVPLLRDLDLEVFSVTSGDEALAALADTDFDVLVTDLCMPGATGIEVMKLARQRVPQARLIMVSGYADEETRQEVEDLGGRLLHKPFGVKELRIAVLGETTA
jgi:two-component system, cell cycle sensor histidine kinase and response regulator CckA